MAVLRIELNHAAVVGLLKSPEVLADLERRGKSIAEAAGEGYEIQTFVGATRARVTVRTETFAAREREATQRSLTRAIDAGRS